jgi:hypothetical protein
MLIILCLAATLVAVDTDKTSPLPADAQKIMNVLDAKIAELQKQAAKDLKKVQDEQAKSGKLDEALAVREVISNLEKQFTPKTDALGNPVVAASPEKAVLGTWRHKNGNHFTVQPKGAVTCTNNDVGEWAINGGKLVITWKSGWIDSFDLPDGDQMSGNTKFGTAVNGASSISASRTK